jgi:hypothetical protein
MAAQPCPSGYLAKGFLAMNLDLRRACEMLDEALETIKKLEQSREP